MFTVPAKAILALADGTVFIGASIGATGQTVGEVVFNTSITGYQEILTDPSYCQQLVTLTYPHIGSYGTNGEDVESAQVFAAGLIVRDLPLLASNFRSDASLSEYLQRAGCVAIAGIDTRQLTRLLRDKGAQNGAILALAEGQAPDQAAVDTALSAFGKVNVLVNNAGIVQVSPLKSIDVEKWNRVLAVNLTGAMLGIKAVLEPMKAAGGGSIINVSSIEGMRGASWVHSYVASKWGLRGLTKSAALELASDNIRVNSVHPTNVNTPLFMNEATMKLFRPDLENPGPEDLLPIGQLMHTLPIGWVEPVDISNAVVFLASDEARYITGVTLPIDAGSCLK